MVDVSETLRGVLSTILANPLYLLMIVGGVALIIILLVVRRIHKIHSEEVFVHQAWGAKWKGR